MTILDALADANLFAPLFRPAASWAAWRAFLAAVYGLPMDAAMRATFQRHTGRAAPPTVPAREAWLVCGRRSGKSRIAATLAVYAAAFRSYDAILSAGERATAMILAADRRQARVTLGYVRGLLHGCPMLATLIDHETREAIHLRNRVTVEVHTASFKATRGYTVCFAALDESAFYPSEDSAEPDVEIANAIRPGMLSVPGALLVGLSSPHARRGLLWEQYAQHYAKEGDAIVVWQSDTASMNPTVDPAIIAAAYEQDPQRAGAEYGGEFRTDVCGFLDPALIAAAIDSDVRERAPIDGVRYYAGCDLAGGGADWSCLAVAHGERRGTDAPVATLDVLRGWRSADVESIVAEMAQLCARYGVREIVADKYGAAWPVAAFARRGIVLRHAPRNTSETFAEFAPMILTRRVRLVDAPVLAAELRALERRVRPLGKDSISHPPRGHDDHAAAAALALVEADVAATEMPLPLKFMFKRLPTRRRMMVAFPRF